METIEGRRGRGKTEQRKKRVLKKQTATLNEAPHNDASCPSCHGASTLCFLPGTWTKRAAAKKQWTVWRKREARWDVFCQLHATKFMQKKEKEEKE